MSAECRPEKLFGLLFGLTAGAIQLMLTQLISSAWDDGLPASLSEEAFIVHNWLADGSPTVLACAESVHRRALFDAANEVLAELRSAPAAVPVRSSGAQQLSLLVQGMRQQRTAQLDLEGAVAQVLRALPAAGLRMPQASDAPFFPEVDDVGDIARAAWERLAHQWRAFGDDEWRQAVAAVGEEGEEGEDEEGEEGRAARAHALFWEGRQRLLLDEAELHEALWASLCEHISPPWEPPPQGSEVPPPPKRLPAALGGPADEPEAEAEEEHEVLGLVGHAAPRWYCRLHYEDWLLALEALPDAKTAPLRSARFFLSFALDTHGRASAHALYAAACGLMQLLSTLCELQVRGAPRAHRMPARGMPTACPLRSTRSSAPVGTIHHDSSWKPALLRLQALDTQRSGRLDEAALESLVQQRVAAVPRLASQPHLQPGHSFFPFYVAHCTRKLLLLLDPRRRGSVRAATRRAAAPCTQAAAPRVVRPGRSPSHASGAAARRAALGRDGRAQCVHAPRAALARGRGGQLVHAALRGAHLSPVLAARHRPRRHAHARRAGPLRRGAALAHARLLQ